MNTDTKTTTDKSNTIQKLFEVGAHFGFTKRRRHPTVVPYLYGTKDGNDIFDLEKTADQIEEVAALLEEWAKLGKTVMYVGTKDEIKHIVERSAMAVDSPYVINRWIGGVLTNFSEIKKRIKRLLDLEAEQAAGTLDRKYTKKERVILGREMTKLRFNFGGVVSLVRPPDAMVVVDPRHEFIAVEEAKQLGIPVVGILSSDVNVSDVTHPIVMNDSLLGSVTYVLERLVEAQKKGAAAYVVPAATNDRSKGRTTRPTITRTRTA